MKGFPPCPSTSFPSVQSLGSVLAARWRSQESTPPIVALTTRDISDRTAIAEMRELGLANLRELRRMNHQFALWLRGNCTMEELTAPHDGTLSDTRLD